MVAWFYCKIFSVFNSGRQNGELRFKKGGGGGNEETKEKGEEAISDMERDGDVVSLGFAPRFREGLCLCWRLLIHHTSHGPGIRHTPVSPQHAAEFALSPVMHVCPLFPLFSYPCFHPLFLSLSECQGYQQCLRARWTDTVLQQTCFHASSTSSLVHTWAFHSHLRGDSPSLCLLCLTAAASRIDKISSPLMSETPWLLSSLMTVF